MRNTSAKSKRWGTSGRAVVGALCLASIAAFPAQTRADDCPFSPWFKYRGVQVYGGDKKEAYFFRTDWAAVDADGAPNAYHPDDSPRRCRRDRQGLDCLENAGYPDTDWWPSVLAEDPSDSDKAFVQPSGPYKGFFVSMTSLTDPANHNVIDRARYVDASAVPYFVFPEPFRHVPGVGTLGDLGVAYHTVTGLWTPFIVADVGPSEPLGEASIALFAALTGRAPDAGNGDGLVDGDIQYILFPNSVAERKSPWPVSAEQIDSSVRSKLAQLGGIAVFDACQGLR